MTIIKLIAFVLILLSTHLSAQDNVIKVGVVEFPPHVFATADSTSGPLIDYMTQIFNKHSINIEFVLLPNKRAERELSKGNIDLLVPYSMNNNSIAVLETPIFNVVPGMCFRKENYIPFLSAPGKLEQLNIGIPANFELVPALQKIKDKMKPIEGSDVLDRGVKMLLRGRIEALYHPSPINVYHYSSPMYNKLACSYFYGFSRPNRVAISRHLKEGSKTKIVEVYETAMSIRPYEYYLLDELSKHKQ